MRFAEIIGGLLSGNRYTRTDADGDVREAWICQDCLLVEFADERLQRFIEAMHDFPSSPDTDDLLADDWEEIA